MEERKFKDLESWQQELIQKAESVMRNAYNLFSHFYVGAAILTESGKTYLGTFAENSSQGGTVCAERAALLAANTEGERNIKAIAVIDGHEKFDCEECATPCGICRQFIHDFSEISGKDIQIICSNTKKDKILITSIRELLPLPYGPKNLKHDLSRFRK